MSKSCAYCRQVGNLTQEHVLPACLHDRLAHYDGMVIPRMPGKMIGGQLTIGDVCATCNNSVLSTLDDYACQLFDQYFSKFVARGDKVEFEYDFDMLARWLLKVAYNMDRTSGKPRAERLAQYSNYILGEAPRPDNLYIFCLLAVPSKIPDEDITEDDPDIVKETGEFPPMFIAVRNFNFTNDDAKNILVYFAIIHSYVFYIILPEGEEPAETELENEFLDVARKSMQAIDADSESIVLHSSETDSLYLVKRHELGQ